MAQTFSIERRNLSEASFPRREDTWVISVDPVEKHNPNGSKTVSVGFPVLALSGWVGEPEKFAALVAEVLTKHLAAAADPAPEWRDLAELRGSTPKMGETPMVDVRTTVTYRWLPYKPDGARQTGRTGRWQRAVGEYGGWENAPLPECGDWKPNLPIKSDGEAT